MFSSSPYTSSCVWSHAPLPTRTGAGVAPAAQVRQLALGEVVLAADPVHDLQRARRFTFPPAQLVMKETKFSASSGQVPMYRASSVRLASLIHENR